MDTPGGVAQGVQETGVPESQTSLMEKWDALDEEAAKLKTEADKKLFDLTKNAHEWATKQNLPWLVPDTDGRFTVNSLANVYHFKTADPQGKELFLEVENRQTYVSQDQIPNSPQQVWEHDVRVRSFTGEPQKGGALLGTVRFHYRVDGLESVDAMRDSLGSIEYYPPEARDFDYTSEHDGYTIADIVYDQEDNMVDMVRLRHSDPAKRKDPFLEAEQTLRSLSASEILGRFDPYTKQRLAVETT